MFCIKIVYFPLEPGEYVPIVFIPGLYGIVTPDMYSDTLEHLASHGYVVVAMNTILPSVSQDGLQKPEIFAKRVYEEIQWVGLYCLMRIKTFSWLYFLDAY